MTNQLFSNCIVFEILSVAVMCNSAMICYTSLIVYTTDTCTDQLFCNLTPELK